MSNQPYLLLLLLIAAMIFLGAMVVYTHATEPGQVSVNASTTVAECDRDADCLKAGCSNQLCLPRDKAVQAYSTCEWRDEYACYAQASCLCQNHACRWEGDQQFSECLTAAQRN